MGYISGSTLVFINARLRVIVRILVRTVWHYNRVSGTINAKIKAVATLRIKKFLMLIFLVNARIIMLRARVNVSVWANASAKVLLG